MDTLCRGGKGFQNTLQYPLAIQSCMTPLFQLTKIKVWELRIKVVFMLVHCACSVITCDYDFTVAILAQGTHWAVADMQAFFSKGIIILFGPEAHVRCA